MVLWEITLGTAYFLGLRRTYRLALRIQRRLVSPRRPKIRQFLHRRTRAIFDVALKVQRSIQERDIEGRSFFNRVLRCLDRMKPSAQIRGSLEKPHGAGSASRSSMTKQVSNAPYQKTQGATTPKSSFKGVDQDSNRHLFSSSRYIWDKPFPAITMMMRPPTSASRTIQYRQVSGWGTEIPRLSSVSGWGTETSRSSSRIAGSNGVIRKDIMQWMLHN